MRLWGEDIPDELLDTTQREYLEHYAGSPLPEVAEVWRLLDAVWHEMSMNAYSDDAIMARYYSHPVWMLNGVFTASDPESRTHRDAIADWIATQGVRRIADFGGGGGHLAKTLAERLPYAQIDVIEPYPSPLGCYRTRSHPGIRWLEQPEDSYDAVIAQDVLEHVRDPVALTQRLCESLTPSGYLVLANCFYPVIRCHLPQLFFLRHTFDWVVRPLGLRRQGAIPGADHIAIYMRDGECSLPASRVHERVAHLIGTVANGLEDLLKRFRGPLK